MPLKQGKTRSDYKLHNLLRFASSFCYYGYHDTSWCEPAFFSSSNDEEFVIKESMLLLYQATQHALKEELDFEPYELVSHLVSHLRSLLQAISKLSCKELSIDIEQTDKGRYITYVGYTEAGKAFINSLEQEYIAYELQL